MKRPKIIKNIPAKLFLKEKLVFQPYLIQRAPGFYYARPNCIVNDRNHAERFNSKDEAEFFIKEHRLKNVLIIELKEPSLKKEDD